MKQPERKDLGWRMRLALAVGGLFIAIYGYGQVLRGKLIYTNWRGQYVPAFFVIFLGVVFLFASIFPWGRIKFLWDSGPKHRWRR